MLYSLCKDTIGFSDHIISSNITSIQSNKYLNQSLKNLSLSIQSPFVESLAHESPGLRGASCYCVRTSEISWNY